MKQAYDIFIFSLKLLLNGMWKPSGFGYLGLVIIVFGFLSVSGYTGYPFSMSTIIVIIGVLLFYMDQQIQSRKKHGPLI